MLVLKVDPRIVDALVAHAQTAPMARLRRVEEPPLPPRSPTSPAVDRGLEVPELDEVE